MLKECDDFLHYIYRSIRTTIIFSQQLLLQAQSLYNLYANEHLRHPDSIAMTSDFYTQPPDPKKNTSPHEKHLSPEDMEWLVTLLLDRDSSYQDIVKNLESHARQAGAGDFYGGVTCNICGGNNYAELVTLNMSASVGGEGRVNKCHSETGGGDVNE